MPNKIRDLIETSISKEEFKEIQSLINYYHNTGVSFSEIAKKIGINKVSVESIANSEDGIRIAYRDALIPTLKFILDNTQLFSDFNEKNTILSRCIEECSAEYNEYDNIFMRYYMGLEGSLPEVAPDSLLGSYFGYRMSSQNTGNEDDNDTKIIRFFMRIKRDNTSRLLYFHNIYEGTTFGERHTKGHIIYINTRAYLAGVSMGVGDHPEIKFRKSFILQSTGFGDRSLRGAVSTISKDDEPIISRCFLIPVESHRNVSGLTNEEIPKFNWNDTKRSVVDFTKRVSLKEVIDCLPERYAKDGENKNILLDMLDNNIGEKESVFKIRNRV